MITFFDYINCSKDEELICRTSQNGLNIYDTNNFELLIKLDPYRLGLSGDITKVKLFYNTQIIAFSLIETQTASKDEEILYNDSKIKKHSLILYDLKNYEIIGKITMKNFVEINDFLITKYFIIIMIENKNKSIIFKTANLEYFKTITNAENGRMVYSDDYYISKYVSKKKKTDKKEVKNEEQPKTEFNKCVLAYQDTNDKKKIHFIDCILSEEGTKVLGIRERSIDIQFNSNEVRYFGFVSSYLIVSSAYGNKVHLYSIATGELKYCLFLGNFPYEISGIHLDNKEKIISIITNNKYIKLYKLNKLNTKCKCSSHNDEKISMTETRGMFDKFKHKLGVGRNNFLCRYKININEFDIKDNNTLVFFDKNVNDVLFIVQKNKVYKRIKFDRKKNKDMIVLHEATLPKYTVNKNDLRSLSLIEEEEKKENEEKKEIKDGNNHKHSIIDDDDIEEDEHKNDEKKQEEKKEDEKKEEEKKEKEKKDEEKKEENENPEQKNEK